MTTKRIDSEKDDRICEDTLRYLKRSHVPDSAEFRARVMAEVRETANNKTFRMKHALLRPRQSTWNLATVLMVVLVLFVSSALFVQQAKQVDESQFIKVQFELPMRDANEVALVGAFNRWQPTTKMVKDAHGIWHAQLQLKPGRYEYLFLVDGQKWVLDPNSRARQDDGFGNNNSVLTVGYDDNDAI